MKKNIDPVCGMEGKDSIKAEYNGKTYYFCAQGCKDQFLKNPLKYTR
jgi:YHS domain-containing protein